MSSLNKSYLILYNVINTGLWGYILTRVLSTIASDNYARVFDETDELVRYVQTGALLEIVHSLLGLVRSPLITTLLQVISRLWVVWGIAYMFPDATRQSPTFPTMLVAWGVTEVVRYSYFAFNLLGSIPSVLSFLRYNMFFVLYPLGIASECWCIWEVIKSGDAKRYDERAEWILWISLAIYVPGSYTLYTHMMKQRRRVLRGKQKAK